MSDGPSPRSHPGDPWDPCSGVQVEGPLGLFSAKVRAAPAGRGEAQRVTEGPGAPPAALEGSCPRLGSPPPPPSPPGTPKIKKQTKS